MWNDIETTTDYLHFSVISKTVAELIIESRENPISIGVSGSWGSGKSSMVKMIGKELENKNRGDSERYVFLEFNAWLYQGYDDAKNALLQVVTKKLSDEVKKNSQENETLLGRFEGFVKKVNWFQVSKLAFPLLLGLLPGAVPIGSIASLVNAITGTIKSKEKSQENSEAITNAIEALGPEIKGLIKDEATKTATQQIEDLRNEFEGILKELKIKLVVLVDDLDRCLPETAISTLEAMRLLLFVKRTAFIIAADEQMIRNGVRAHFGDVELSDGLVTSYFDKLIQVPITVPHLGIAEIKIYIVSLFLELEFRRGKVQKEALDEVQDKLQELLMKAWQEDITKEKIVAVFNDTTKEIMVEYISLADQLAGILVTAENIKGNPRLIKRFLNALEIRKKIAKQNGITVDSGLMIKMLLFERCASSSAFEYLSQQVAKSNDGKLAFVTDIENALSEGEVYNAPDISWNTDFVKKWLMIAPKLSEHDIRPLLYLSKDRELILASYDELSPESQNLLAALKEVKMGVFVQDLVKRIKNVGSKESELLLNRLVRIARSNQWSVNTLFAALHIIEAFPELGNTLAIALSEIPAKSRNAAMLPLIYSKEWAKPLMNQWSLDTESPQPVKNYFKQKAKEK